MERKLIDVSYHDGKIDWQQVKGNVDGAIIRCGYGSDLKEQDDTMFLENVNGCIANEIPFGVYLYSYAKNTEAAKSEAAHVLRLVNPFKNNFSYPVYLDLEEAETEENIVERAITFGNILEDAGYWCGIYSNQYWWNTYLKDGLDRFTKWVAKYGVNDGVPHEKPNVSGYDIWQYTSNGTVPGISQNVDLNLCYRDFPEEIRKSMGSGSAPTSAPSIPYGDKSDEELAEMVRRGDFGNGEERKKRLGSRYAAVQAIVNRKEAELPYSGRITGTGVRVRKGPGTNYAIIGATAKGQLVRVYEEKDGWSRVDKDKWISKEYISRV